MDNLGFMRNYLLESIAVKENLLLSSQILSEISKVAETICTVYKNGNKVILAGNGGSAADCQHIAAEFVSRFFFDRPGLPALALSTDTSMLTAIGNDYGFDKIFSRQLQAQSRPGDLFIGISTSGNSSNVVDAVNCSRELGLYSVVFCGQGGVLSDLADIAIKVPSTCTPYIQECHICIGHMLCAVVEQRMFGADNV